MANWDQPQTVTVTGVNDPIDNAFDRTATISHGISGGGYDNVSAANVTVIATDDDTPGLELTRGSLLVQPEGGGNRFYRIRLTSRPTHDVTVTAMSSDPTVATPFGGPWVFNSTNWDREQFVGVSVVNDDIRNDPSRRATMTHTLTSTDGNYNMQGVTPVTVIAADDDAAGVTLSRSTLTFSEAEIGAADEDDEVSGTYTIRLNSQPTADVTVTPTIAPAGLATVPGPLTFTPTGTTDPATGITTGRWDQPQTVKVTATAMDDTIDNEPDRAATISHAIAGGGYDRITVPTVAVTIQDNDGRTPGVTVSETDLSMTEGETASYTVVLTSPPTGNVRVTPVSSDPTVADRPDQPAQRRGGDRDHERRHGCGYGVADDAELHRCQLEHRPDRDRDRRER